MSTAYTMPMIKARDRLTGLPEELELDPQAVTVTLHGEPVLAILPWNLYESIVETLEILGDRDLTTALRQAIKEVDEGQTISWEQAKQEL